MNDLMANDFQINNMGSFPTEFSSGITFIIECFPEALSLHRISAWGRRHRLHLILAVYLV